MNSQLASPNVPSSNFSSPSSSFGGPTPSAGSSSAIRVHGSSRCSSVVGGFANSRFAASSPSSLTASEIIASPRAYGAPMKVCRISGTSPMSARAALVCAAFERWSAARFFLLRDLAHSVSIRLASPSTIDW